MKPHTSPIGAFFEHLTSTKGIALAIPAVLLVGAALAMGRTPVVPAAPVAASVPAPATVQAAAPVAAAAPVQVAQAAPVQAAPAAPVQAAPAASGGAFTAAQKKEIEALIKPYLLANPEVLMEVQTALEAKMEKIQAEKMSTALKENAAEIFRAPSAPIAGNLKGDVTVVEFFDYNCGYCKKAFVDLLAASEKDKNLKLVMKEFPILSKGSEEAARAALAAKAQGKYWEFHRALLESPGQANEASALKVAEKIGLNIAKLKTDMAGAEVKAEIDRTRALAQKLGIQGTPHFLVGDKPIGGAPEGLSDLLLAAAAEVRKNGGCKVC
jgi:protein-disulfide isomerase